MAQTKAVYYRDKHGHEPVNRFIDRLPAKRAAKIDDYVEEHLSGRPPDAPPPEYPITSQIEGAAWRTSSDGWTQSHECRRGQRVKMLRLPVEEGVDKFIYLDKLAYP